MDYIKKLALRISLGVILGLFFSIFYTIFSPITLWLSKVTLKMLNFEVITAAKDLLIVNGIHLKFVEACTAASAYYLLALLILVTMGISLKKGIALFGIGSLMILAMNIIRIDILVYVLTKFGEGWFDYAHLFFWKVVSTVFVAATWIFLIKVFNVKEIPVYSDFMYLLKLTKKKKKKRSA